MSQPVTVPRVVLAAFESAQILDVTGPLEVFSTASRFAPGVNYDICVASVGGGMVSSRTGLSFSTIDLTDCRTPVDTLIVAGAAETWTRQPRAAEREQC